MVIRLIRRGLRRRLKREFYKLYVEPGNDLALYDPSQGIIDARALKPDSQQVRIVAYDANGNSSTLLFPLVFDQSPLIVSFRAEESEDSLRIQTQFDDADDFVKKLVLEKSLLDKIHWKRFVLAEFNGPESEYSLSWPKSLDEPYLIRIKAQDSYGASSEYEYVFVDAAKTETPASSDEKSKTELDFEYTFKDNFFLFTLNFSQVLKEKPQVTLRCGDFEFDPFLLEQVDVRGYRAVLPFYLKEPKQMTLEVNGQDIYNDSIRFEHVIPISIVTAVHVAPRPLTVTEAVEPTCFAAWQLPVTCPPSRMFSVPLPSWPM